jgi:ATP/maltotriose-dependent transcriptional regulator MalT/DNA-binding SARP family transcriptional activator
MLRAATVPGMVLYTPLWKRTVPPAAPDLVARPDLLRRLDGIAHRLIHICAGPGYGKTTQVAMWARQRDDAAWYSVGDADRDLATFAAGLLAAVEHRLHPDVAAALPGPLGPDAASDRTVEATAAAVAEIVERGLESPLILVLDGCADLPDGSAGAALLRALIRQAPHRLRLVLLGRTQAPVPLAELRGRGLVADVRAGDLALTEDQTASVLAAVLGPDAAALAAAVHRYTGGWPAAVRMLAETLVRVAPGVRAARLAALEPAGDALVDYLAQEVVARSAARIQPLWRLAGGQPRFTAGLCRAAGLDVTGADLRDLAHRGLLTLVEDGADPAFAVPPMLAAAARTAGAEPDPARRRAFAAAAVRWFHERGRPAEALHAVAALGEPEALVDHLAAHGAALVAAGAVAAVADAVGKVPAALIPPAVHMVAGHARYIQGDWDAALAHFRRAASGSGPVPAGLAWRMGLIHYDRGDLDAALEAFRRGDLADVDCADRAHLLSWTAATYWLRQDQRRCREAADAALAVAAACGDDSALATAHTTCGMAAAMAGDQNGNTMHYAAAQRAAERAGDVLALMRLRNNAGSRALEEGRFRDAVREFDETIRLAELTGYASVLALAVHNRGLATFALGRLDEAAAEFATALAMYRRLGSRMVAYPLMRAADVHRVRGNLDRARAGYEEAVARSRAAGDRQGCVPALAGLARTVSDDDPDRADALVAEALDSDAGIGEVEVTLAAGWIALVRADIPGAAAWAARALSAAGTRRQGPRLAEAIELAALAGPPAERDARLAEAAELWAELGHGLGAAVNAYLRTRLAGEPSGSAEYRLRLMSVPGGADRAGAARHAAGPLRWLAGDHAPPAVRLRTLGGFVLLRDEAEVTAEQWRSRKARDLLKLLVAHRGRTVSRDVAAETLWPGEAPARLPNRLSVALSTLRTVLDPGRRFPADHYVLADRAGLRLGALDVDVLAFLRTAEEGMRHRIAGRADRARAVLAAAETMYTGDFLADDPYPAWTTGLRDEAGAAYVRAVRTLADLAADDRDTDTAVQYLLRLLAHDPHDEAAHLRLVAVLRAGGRHGEARRCYRRYTECMADLDIEPAPFPGGSTDAGVPAAHGYP